VKDYECGRCKGFHDDEEEVKIRIILGNDMIEVVQEFCYYGEFVRSNDVQSTVTARIRAG